MSGEEVAEVRDLGEKLFDLRDLYGNPKFENIENLRMLNEAVSSNPSIVGIAPYGSTVGGYSIEDSDYDLRIIWDSSKTNNKDALEAVKEVHNSIKKAIGDIPRIENKKVTFIEHDINPNLVIEALNSDHPNAINSSVYNSLAHVCRLVTGDKIQNYRELFANEINKLSKEKQEKIISQIADYFAAEDSMRNYKIQKRTNMSNTNIAHIVRRRKRLWEKRARKIFKVEDFTTSTSP